MQKSRITMMKSLSIAVITGIFLLTYLDSNAGNIKVTRNVKSGKSSYLESILSFNVDTCSHFKANVDIVTAPKFGTISVKVGKPKNIGKIKGRNRKCEGKYLKGLDIIYTSKKNYRGRDFVKLLVTYPGWPSFYNNHFSFNIKVR